jgi:uncharacterized protein
MKVWIDLTNSPHINFFEYIIQDLKNDGHEIIITCRDLSNTIELIKLKGWSFTEIGGHAGAKLWKKILYFPRRILGLRRFLSSNKPDIAISHSSFYSPLAASLVGVPSIYINDNEHAKGNYLAFPFATLVLLPEFLKKVAEKKKWNRIFKLRYYPGTKEAIYLSKKYQEPIDAKKTGIIFFRPEPWSAQYYKAKKSFIDELLVDLCKEYAVYVLPRSNEQVVHYQQDKFHILHIVEKPISLEEIISKCELFIGAGGTMTREIAILGIPTISIYQDDLLQVDNYLIDNKIMYHTKNLNRAIIDMVLNNAASLNNKNLSQKGKEAHKLIIEKITEFKRS